MATVVATLAPASAFADRPPDDDAVWQAAADQAKAASPGIPGLALTVLSPGRDMEVSVAAGESDPSTGAPLLPEQPFRIASNTKTFTAAATLRLVEKHRLRLDDAISQRLPSSLVDELRRGGYDLDVITVRQLLHTAGLYDHATDPAYVLAVASDPTHRWTRFEQVRFAMDHGAPVNAPGQARHYSDTGYILLGAIIEGATGHSLARSYRQLLHFERLGLNHTWLETTERAPRGIAPRVHQFLGDIDATEFDPSFDLYGGGGLVSTTGDLARFYDALLAFSCPEVDVTVAYSWFQASPNPPPDLTPSAPPLAAVIDTCPRPDESKCHGWTPHCPHALRSSSSEAVSSVAASPTTSLAGAGPMSRCSNATS